MDIKEEIVGLYHSIDNLTPDISCPIIQFVSSHPGEGVSTISRELATIAVERFGKSVLLLDASEEQFIQEKSKKRHEKNPGQIGDEKADREETGEHSPGDHSDKSEENGFTAYHARLENPHCFHIGSFQKAGTSVSVIFSSKYYQDYAELLRQNYDLVLIDSPPLSNSTIALAISSKVDGVVLVVAAETTRWPVAESVKARIEKTGGNILGLVLNKQKHYIPRFIYRHLL